MSGVKLFKLSEAKFEPYGGPPGRAQIWRQVGADLSKTMGGGIGTFEGGVSIPWTVRYDEFLVGIEGRFRLRAGKNGSEVYEMGPGDVIWLPADEPIIYEADQRAVVFYSLYPVDWRARMERQAKRPARARRAAKRPSRTRGTRSRRPARPRTARRRR